VLHRAGQTEAAVDLARLAGFSSAGVICEVMKDDGTMARVPDLIEFCARHELKLVTVADLIEYRRKHEKLVEREIAVRLPTAHGTFTAVLFRETLTGKQHVALVHGEVEDAEDVLVRVHSECLTGDVFHSLRCDCAEQLDAAGYLTLIDPPGWDPRANGEVRPVEPDMTCWLLRAAKPLDDGEDLVARHGAVESMVRQHRGRYDGGETGWLPTGDTAA